MTPAPPDFDTERWMNQPYGERLRRMCASWAMRGFGAPGVAYLFYVVKLGLYVGGFLLVATTTRGIGGVGDFGDWWSQPIVFQKAVVWTLLFEVLGLGCASGPLTARYVPPITAFLYWLRPSTTRLAPFHWMPLTSGHRRSLVDVALYVTHLALLVRALLAPEMTKAVVVPILVVFGLLGLRDKTIFLASRSEHYLLALFVFLFPRDFWAGEQVVQAALWFGAATSKLNHHFPNVIAVMMSNNPLLRSQRARRRLYRGYPNDLRASRLVEGIAHGATVVEYSFPLVLLFSDGGTPTTVALIVMVVFHSIILTSFPLGVPLEWNVFFIYSGLVLFGAHAEVHFWSIDSPLLIAVLLACLVVVPVVGNLRPDKVSFLMAMRYYAGNWGTSLWLWRPSALVKLDERITKAVDLPRQQLEGLYGEGAYELTLGRVQAFRSMHLHGRALNQLLPQAIADLQEDEVAAKGLDAFEVIDGELVAGIALGWNFGEGHLHDERLLAALHDQCGFAPGELRCVFLESQPAGKSTLHWRIADASTGQIAEGVVSARGLLDIQPWATLDTVRAHTPHPSPGR
jgi:hypothetical protein